MGIMCVPAQLRHYLSLREFLIICCYITFLLEVFMRIEGNTCACSQLLRLWEKSKKLEIQVLLTVPWLCYSSWKCMYKLTTGCYHSYCQYHVLLHSLILLALNKQYGCVSTREMITPNCHCCRRKNKETTPRKKLQDSLWGIQEFTGTHVRSVYRS